MKPQIRVLIVEDDLVDRMACCRALAAHPLYVVVTAEAESGAEGLAYVRGEAVDCILLDYQLPDLNGVEFLEALAAHGGQLEVPVVMLTGADRVALAVEAMKRGARDYLVKDVERQYLQLLPARISRVVEEQRLREEKRLAEEALRESREQLQALSAHLQAVREEEKAVIAREIHDELGSTLAALKMDTAWLSDRLSVHEPAVRNKVEAMNALVDAAVASVRQIVTSLRPTVLDDLGLWAAIEWQLNEFTRHRGIYCKWNNACDHLTLPPSQALALFRVLQEALTNVARHAAAAQVWVDCWADAGLLRLTIQDDGVGVTDEVLSSPVSHGIRGMFERIRQLGGTLEIQGAAGAGTSLRIRLPLPGHGGGE